MSANRLKSDNRTSSLQDPSQVLEGVLMDSKSPLSDQFQRWKLERKWNEIVGATISAQSEPIGYNNGVLYVLVKNAVWMQEMLFLAGPLKEKVNAFVGKKWVHQVRFTLTP